ncbi:MAG: glycerophosphodiester phosphodiesterase [Chitinophagales bacterium]|nr:glycerophosphodiester phosphodiesterase [Chitinophagales bacterium]
MKSSLLIILLITGNSCTKIHYFPDKHIVIDSPRIIAHRGGRTETLPENSLEGCISVLPLMDGIEVDVQISNDKTIWLSHSPIVEDCGHSLNCFAATCDYEIEKISSCIDTGNAYGKLEDVLKYMNDNDIRKYICIDLKAWEPCNINSLNIPHLMNLEADKIIELGEKYQLSPYLLFESETSSVLKHVNEKNVEASTYLISYGDYDTDMAKALEHNFDGISFKTNFKDELDADKMNLLHQKGLRLLAWNVPDSSYLEYLKSIEVDFIMWDLE